MSDNRLYNMINETEYQANLFAADLLIQDEDVAALSKQEDLDYFSLPAENCQMMIKQLLWTRSRCSIWIQKNVQKNLHQKDT